MISTDGESKIFPGSHKVHADIVHWLKLNRSRGILLNHDGSSSNFPIADDVANPSVHQVATIQLTIDCESEKGLIPTPSVRMKKKAYRSNLTGLESPLSANLTSGVPKYSLTSVDIAPDDHIEFLQQPREQITR